MNARILTAALLAMSLAAGCKDKKEEAPAAPPVPAAPTPAPVPTPPPPPAVETVAATAAPAPTAPAADPGPTLSTTVDFEQDALDQINPQNIEQQLDQLEKEIGTK